METLNSRLRQWDIDTDADADTDTDADAINLTHAIYLLSHRSSG